MGKIASIALTVTAVLLSFGCGPSMKTIIEARLPELKKMDMGTFDLGEFRSGQTTPFRIAPAAKGPRYVIGFRPEPENRHFNIVLDDGRVFMVDDDDDLKKIARLHLDKQSFYLEFKQDMRMVLIVFDPRSAGDRSGPETFPPAASPATALR